MLFGSGIANAQSTRSSVNKGVDLYKEKKFVDSEVEFKKGMEKSPKNFQANFNLGDSYYKQGKYEDALKAYSLALTKTDNKDLKSLVYHNIGNSLLKSNKIKESIGAYVNSLNLDPNDQATKYNLSYALDMMKKQDKNQKNKNDKNNKDKNQQNKKDQNKNKNEQNKKDQNKQNQDKQNQNQQNKDQQNKQKQNQNQNQQNQQEPNKISKQQAQAILNALNNNEKDLQKKLRKIKGAPNKTGKDW